MLSADTSGEVPSSGAADNVTVTGKRNRVAFALTAGTAGTPEGLGRGCC
ncbi:hypothetical protein SLNHY_2564 [Streptomyces albus]|nr:hypothetical protein SLNHY_2564 [Streptomyces albus]